MTRGALIRRQMYARSIIAAVISAAIGVLCAGPSGGKQEIRSGAATEIEHRFTFANRITCERVPNCGEGSAGLGPYNTVKTLIRGPHLSPSATALERHSLLKLSHTPLEFCRAVVNGADIIVNLQRISQDRSSPKVIQTSEFGGCQWNNL